MLSSPPRGTITETSPRKSRNGSPAQSTGWNRRPTFRRSRASSPTCTANTSPGGAPGSRCSSHCVGGRRANGDPDAAGAVARSVAILRYAGDIDTSLAHLPTDDRITVLATASSALVANREWKRAITAYAQALQLAEPGLSSGSPALRALAVAGNNMAASLEEKADRDPVETRGMVAAAEGGLRYWRLAGTWLEEERAEYRLARSLLQAGNPASAVEHASRCVDICAANDAPPFERFFGYAVLAIAHARAGDRAAQATARRLALDQYAAVAPDEKRWCEADRNELES